MNSVTITQAKLKSWLTPRGGYTGAQLRLLLPLIDEDPSAPLVRGWPQRLVGVIISPEQETAISEARYVYSSRRRTAQAQAEREQLLLPVLQPVRAPSANSANEVILRAWRDRRGFLSRLADARLTDDQLADVLNAIDHSCTHCWDGEVGCQCWNDE